MSRSHEQSGRTKAVLHDVTRCTGCMTCVATCSVENGLVSKADDARFNPGELSAERFISLKQTKEHRFVRTGCLHCLEPSCVSACLVGALHRREDGRVVYDAGKCIGCRYCMLACPAHVIRYEWDSALPFVKKCDMCADRPQGPACVEACPSEVSIYGDRDELLKIAHERIAAQPDLYQQKVWGEHELGGTGVLYVSDVSLSSLWPESLGDRSIPSITWPIARSTPFLAFGVASCLIGASWLIGRRNKLAEEKACAAAVQHRKSEED